MPTMLEKIVQLGYSARTNNENCHRNICRRCRYCVPPRDNRQRSFCRCPVDADDAWVNWAAIVGKVAERLMKIAETSRASRGLPPPFAPRPVPDHLDLRKPLDFAALLAPMAEAE